MRPLRYMHSPPLLSPCLALVSEHLGQGQENGDISGCASFQPAVQPTTSCTLAAPPTPSLAFTTLSPITFSPTLASSPPPASTASYMITRPNTANVPSSKPSATVVAVISIASFLGLASLLLGALLYARARRSFQHRSRIRVSDSEFGTLNTYDYWRTSGDAPPRPRNPYEGSVPSHVPLLPPDPDPPIVHVTALSPRLRTTGRS
ncbi:hypothetical protein EDC04DRAFT_186830 [Pisolithus marmoratus]|nr:hypothetical protein EDC04DRAFT_186830 [Pisolithus marmoratus]